MTTEILQITKVEKQRRRQMAYINRARNARLYGKLLIPVMLVTLSTGLWSDPVLGPQLKQGAEEIRPMLASYAQNTPLEEFFGPAPESEATRTAAAAPETVYDADGNPVVTEEASLVLPSNLPASRRPVNRPVRNNFPSASR